MRLSHIICDIGGESFDLMELNGWALKKLTIFNIHNLILWKAFIQSSIGLLKRHLMIFIGKIVCSTDLISDPKLLANILIRLFMLTNKILILQTKIDNMISYKLIIDSYSPACIVDLSPDNLSYRPNDRYGSHLSIFSCLHSQTTGRTS